ncbi:MAG: tetratricopeptide repeat protein [Bacteroidales bacterium]|nr:tetratricopeptide repeat protein [Bacteroidales bacterium]
MKKRLLLAAAAALLALAASAQTPEYTRALDLYGHGMYAEAARLLENIPGADAEGYAALCAIEMQSPGYEKRAEDFVDRWPESLLVPQVNFRWAQDLFDRGEYAQAAYRFGCVAQDELYKGQVPEYSYKRGYSAFEAGDADHARILLERMQRLPYSDYTAPSQYSLAYVCYSQGDFKEAENWFSKAAEDPRFADLANYYILECRFNQKDYNYVVKAGEKIFNKIPEDRQAHFARMMSESYLVLGDNDKARSYYQKNLAEKGDRTRSDYFYAGSVMYGVEDWQGAVDNFAKMEERTDSLGQIANYQMGYSYIQLRNKVAALDAFREASALAFNKDIQEDAYFNYAKLAFDLNNDVSAFNDYVKRYDALSKGDQIYSYMAMAALQSHDYEAAVAAYDNIEELDPRMQSNYMKAYFLRANQLIENGSWRDAIPRLRTAAYYSPRQDPFNQLSRYWVAESYFRDEKYLDARSTLIDLYNLSALDGKKEGDLIPYNIAYTYFKEGDYPSAMKWFNTYLEGRHDAFGSDAETRIGDCYFFQKDYASAITAFERKLADYPDADDIYPYFRAGVACGLVNDFPKKVQFLERVKKASASAPYYSEAMYELGRAYVSVGKEDDAVKAFNTLRGTTDDPAYATKALLELGMIARNGGDDAKALEYYKQVATQGGDYADDALLAIESIYRSRQEPDSYLAFVNSLGDKASRTEAQKEDVYFGTAEEIFLGGNYAKAETTFKSYLEKYPNGAKAAEAEFYLGECYRGLGDKEKAVDHYTVALDRGLNGSFKETAYIRMGDLSYSLQRYADAYDAYRKLLATAQLDDNKSVANLGMMRSAYKAREFDNAIAAAQSVRADKRVTDADKREADYIRAKSCLGMSRRAEAYGIFEQLAKDPSTDEGAEAAYLIIQDQFDRADFAGIQDKVYDFSAKAGGQNYWLAKAFIVLGDTFAENDNMAQAKATFESIKSGYKPYGPEDDVLDQVELRLRKL